jgi:hypothetical protein
MGRLLSFNTRLRKVIKARCRLLVAFLLLLIVIIVLGIAIGKDFTSKIKQRYLAGIAAGKLNNYILSFNSIDWNNETINGTLVFQGGLPIWEEKEVKILYGELVCQDLTHPYVMFNKKYFDSVKDLFIMKISLQKKSSFTESKPKSKDVNIQMVGNREMFPFDRYLIVGAVRCPAYFNNGEKQTNINDLKDEENLAIKNLIPGVFMRQPKPRELTQAKSTFMMVKDQVVTKTEINELNNWKNTFALIIERPLLLKFLTVVLGFMALWSAIYIGWIARFDAIPLQIAGYVVALWGIRNNLLGDIKSFPSPIDYTMLFMYLIIFLGMICRKIANKKDK